MVHSNLMTHMCDARDSGSLARASMAEGRGSIRPRGRLSQTGSVWRLLTSVTEMLVEEEKKKKTVRKTELWSV